MGYCDYTDQWLRDLTRQRRAEAKARRERPQPIRYSVTESVESEAVVCVAAPTVRRKSAYRAWRRAQWADGNRDCFYCRVRMNMPPPRRRKNWLPNPRTATVDHRVPLAQGGDDAAWNWVMACNQCNNRKGQMTDEQFRATFMLAAE